MIKGIFFAIIFIILYFVICDPHYNKAAKTVLETGGKVIYVVTDATQEALNGE